VRNILAAMTLAATFGLVGVTGASAAPVSGVAIVDAAATGSMVEDAQFSRRRCNMVTRRVHRAGSRVRVTRFNRCNHRGGRRWR